MKLKWQQAPVKTQCGDEMVLASVAIDKDHTLSLYCERDQAPKVEAMFAQRKPLTDEEIESSYAYEITKDKECFRAGVLWAQSQLKENT